MKQWGQALKDSKATPEAPCPALKIKDAAAEILLLSDAPARVAEAGDGATPAQTLAQPEVPRKGYHEEGGRKSTNLPLGIKQVSRQCTSPPTVGGIHTSSDRHKEVGPPCEGKIRSARSCPAP